MLFNHEQIYNKIRDRFVQRGYDIEFGSNTQQIQNSMAYLVSMLNQNTQTNIRETILTSQTKRNMILEGARLFGYEAIPKRSYKYEVTIKLTNKTGQNRNFSLHSHAKFVSGGNTYHYLGDSVSVVVPRAEYDPIEMVEIPGEVYLFDLVLTEGEMHSYKTNKSLEHIVRFESVNHQMVPETYVDVPFMNVEDDGIFLKTLTKMPDGVDIEEIWTKSDIFLSNDDTVNRRLFIRQDHPEFGTPRVFLNYGNQGTGNVAGSKVMLDILISKGINGEAGDSFKFTEDHPEIDIEVIEHQEIRAGSNEETNSSIQKNAPRFNNTARRVVTMHDYKTIQSRHPNTSDSQIWDGFDELEKIQGHIWFSFVPSTRGIVMSDEIDENPIQVPAQSQTWVLLDSEEDERNFVVSDGWDTDDGSSISDESVSDVASIFRYMKTYSVPTLTFNYRQPIYLDFDVRINMAQYNQHQSTKESNDQIFESVHNFFTGARDKGIVLDDRATLNTVVEKFEGSFFSQELTERIKKEVVADTMFNIAIRTSAYLDSKHISNDVQDTGNIVFRLGAEHKPFMSDGYIMVESLPDITTPNLQGDQSIEMPQLMDFTRIRGQYIETNAYRADIIMWRDNNEFIVGEYRIFGNTKAVEIQLYSDSELGQLIEDGFRLNIKYPTPNVTVKKNTFPRLNSVSIISGDLYYDDRYTDSGDNP